MLNEVGKAMRRIKLFSLFQERVARRMCASRWSARRSYGRALAHGQHCLECLESRIMLTFAGRTDFTTDTLPRSVSIVDLNGDGKLDIVTASENDFTISMLMNMTPEGAMTPTYSTHLDFDTPYNVYSVAIGDLNDDGKPDLVITAITYASSVSVLLNTTAPGATTPTFTANTDFEAGVVPRSVAIGDLNDDGKPDLAIANNGSNSVSVLLNTTTSGATAPTFADKMDFRTRAQPHSVAIRDLNSDGKPDLVTANEISGTVSVLLNMTASGATMPTFAGRTDFDAAPRARSVRIEDLNNDGTPDLVTAGLGNHSVSVLLNTTTPGATVPTFAGQTRFSTADADSLAIGDLNNDGRPDLVTNNFYSNNVSVLMNTTMPRTVTLSVDHTSIAEASGQATVTATLSAVSTQDVTVLLDYSGTAKNVLDYTRSATQIVISAGSTTGSITLAAVQDTLDEANETIVVDINGVTNGTESGTQTILVTVTNSNEAPTITSINSASTLENATAVISLTATDPEHGSLSYFVIGGTDQALFNIDSASGALSFKSAPDFENPMDANHDNVYSVQVQVSDGTNLVTQSLSITVTNVDESPSITSSIAENSTFVVTVTGSDPESHLPHFGITGGADQAKFTISFLTGVLSFVSPPDFEHPTDANHDNVYEVQVAISDGTHLVTQDISVTVANVNETVTIPLPANGGNFKTLFLNGQLHLRTSLGKQLVAPVTLPSGADVVFNGSNAADRLTLDRSWSRFAGSLTFNGNGGNDQLDVRTVSLGVTFNGGDDNDTFLGGRGDDSSNGGTGLDSLSGNDGNDSLTGGDGNDKLFGGADGDILAGDAGTDSLSGGDDDDSLSGGDANDTLAGDAGNDTVTGDAGADSITGGDDDDLLLGGTGNDSIDGGRGEDVLDGGDDNDNLKGSDGDDAIRGGIGNDTLSGGNGNDLLAGSAGNDSLLGDAGTDTLLGDDGNDKLNGGLGTDTINGITTGPSKDTISDTTKVIDTSFAFDFDALLADLL